MTIWYMKFLVTISPNTSKLTIIRHLGTKDPAPISWVTTRNQSQEHFPTTKNCLKLHQQQEHLNPYYCHLPPHPVPHYRLPPPPPQQATTIFTITRPCSSPNWNDVEKEIWPVLEKSVDWHWIPTTINPTIKLYLI